MSDYYVILTGGKNNAGDFLIKHRAKRLFAGLRADREIVDLDAWKEFDKDTLDLVNGAKALILMGGPALQERMYPRVYALTKDIRDISVPITTMGIGWHSKAGSWGDTYRYPLSEPTRAVLGKAAASGLPLSVRDFHTLSALAFNGIDNVVMTGCPAYYDLDQLGIAPRVGRDIRKVAFSLGVSFMRSASMEASMKSLIVKLNNYFSGCDFEVVFHHSMNEQSLLASYGKRGRQYTQHQSFAAWLMEQGIAVKDISGSAEGLINYYSDVDFHVGYRVHAHIFMNSISRMSVLIAEDGRGLATERVIGGNVVEGFTCFQDRATPKVLKKIGLMADSYRANAFVFEDVINRYEYEIRTQGQVLNASRHQIDYNFTKMKEYLESLP
ncbi:Polysaccharide pyruvyl transferase [compost metagenome]